MNEMFPADQASDLLSRTLVALDRARARVDALEARQSEPVAIVGMACRLPGGANSPEALWDILRRGADTASAVPSDRWSSEHFYNASPDAPGQTHAARAHFLEGSVGGFDAPFFGISSKEATSLDPQQRLLLEVTWDALEDAGIDPAALRGSPTGVFVGISSDDYAQAHRHSGKLDLIDGYALTGTCFAPAAGRISYSFGFEGPSMAIDTACSSSLVAVHLACQSLRNGETETALAAGVNLILSPVFHIASSKLGTISPDGLCKTFDASADGYGRGEGCGVVILKRLSDAQAQGDRILAVIRGSAVNQDGKSNGLTAPNGLAQEKVIREALARAGLLPGDIGYIEVHGTGTPLGDPIEVEAIGRVMQNQRPADRPVILSTVKPNIGHLEAAAGISGLIKAVQCLRHEAIPPHIHLTNPNPHVPWGQYPFRVCTDFTPWPATGEPRRAGISSFGFSGTNAHVIIESAPPTEAAPASAAAALLLPVSARTPEALDELAQRWVSWLASPGVPTPDACYTAGNGRTHLPFRLAALGRTNDDLANALRGHLDGKPGRTLVSGSVAGGRPKIAALFTGQGSQYAGMGRSLYLTEPVFRNVIDDCDAGLRDALGRSILDLLYAEDADEEVLKQTGFAQPAIFAIQLALYRLWESWGIRADIVCGHSIGEYAAAHVAGILDFSDALALVAERGRLMQGLPAGGAMAAVFAGETAVSEWLSPAAGVSIAAVNTPSEVVVSGPEPAVTALLGRLATAGIEATPLRVSHAFHSSLMRPIVPAFQTAAFGRTYAPARLPIVSTVTGRKAEGGDLASPSYWANQIEAPVRFAAAAETLAAEGVGVFLEMGATPILTGLARQCVASDKRAFLGSLHRSEADGRRTLLESLAQLYAMGADVDWAAVNRVSGGRTAAVPGYPFQHRGYYQAPIVDAGGAGSVASLPGSAHPYLGQRIRSSLLPPGTMLNQVLFTVDYPAFLRDHQIFGKIISPAAAHISMAFAAAGDRPALEDVTFTAPLVVEPGQSRLVQLIVEGEGGLGFRLTSQPSEEPAAAWQIHATGRITTAPAPSRRLDVEAVRARCTGTMAPADFYALIETLGYSTGPDFRCIREIFKGDNESLCRVEAWQKIDDGAIHPGLIDSLLQTVLPACEASARHMLNGDSVLVPLHMASVRVFGSLNRPLYCHTTVAVSDDVVKGQVTAHDSDGRVVLEIGDFLLKRTDRATLYQELRGDDRHLISQVEWVQFSPGDSAQPADDAGWVVFSDAGGWGGAIARACRDRGSESLELLAGGPLDGFAGDQIVFDPRDPPSIEANLLSWLARPDRKRVNILFARHGAAGDPAEACLRTTRDLLGVVKALGTFAGRDKVRLWLLTRQTQSVAPEDVAVPSPALDGAALWGFGRAIGQEYPEFWGGLVDLEPLPSRTGVDALLGLIEAPGGEDQLAIRRGQQVFAARLTGARTGASAADRLRRLPSLKGREAYFLDKGPRRTLDDLVVRTVQRRAPAAGEVEVAVLAAGLNFRDVLNALGQYPGEAGLLGFEAVGTVTACGEDVTGLVPGETVIVLAAPGCIGSHVTVARALVVRKPEGISATDAVTLPATFLTAHYALNYLGNMRQGDRVLIHAAAGGVGLAAVQLALAAGAEVFATAGSEAKHAHLRAMGVTHVMSSRNTDFAGQIRAATGGRGVDMVLNSLSGDFIAASFSVLAPHGRFLEMGKIGIWDEARVRALDPTWLYRPFDLAAVALEDPAALVAMFDTILRDIADGRLRPLPVSVFPMANAEDAFRFMAQGRHIGKIVLSREAERRRERIEAHGLIRADASYLVTGGLGALGLRVARWLVEEGARQIVLTGRRGPDAAASAAIAELEGRGAAIRVVNADIAAPADADRLLDQAGIAPLAGVIHAAGIVDDGMIADLDEAKLQRILAPKVSGTWLLHQATRSMDLDFFVLFSSIAAQLGNLGQSAYAAGNAFMDGLAADRHRRGLAATSINWGPWAESGMAASMQVDRFSAQGIRRLVPAQGLRTLKYLIREMQVQATVADVDWPVFGASHGLSGKTGLFAALVAEGKRGQPEADKPNTVRDITAELRKALPVERSGLLRLYLQDIVRETLGYGESEPIAADQPLVAQGFDSLMSVDMRNRLGRGLGTVLPASLLFDYPTLDRIGDYLLQSVIHFDEAPAESAPAVTADQLLSEIEKLLG